MKCLTEWKTRSAKMWEIAICVKYTKNALLLGALSEPFW